MRRAASSRGALQSPGICSDRASTRKKVPVEGYQSCISWRLILSGPVRRILLVPATAQGKPEVRDQKVAEPQEKVPGGKGPAFTEPLSAIG